MKTIPRITAIFLLLGAIAALAVFGGRFAIHSSAAPADIVLPVLPVSSDVATPTPQFSLGLVEPTIEFKQRIQKKTFGEYITPATSPVANDKFLGYHAGVDVEFTDSLTQVIEVHAIADGTITYRGWMKGYGGVIVVHHIINGVPLFSLYGHLNVATLPPASITQVKAGDVLGDLGNDHSQQTDGVRKHLHFAIYKGATMDYRGYVPNQSDLSMWMNPLDLYQ